MALVVEDGSIVTDADSYVSRVDAVTWITARYPSDPFLAASGADQDAYLRRGVMYQDSYYAGAWEGYRTDPDQTLSWPRTGATDEDGNLIPSDEIPRRVIDSQLELARIYAGGTDPLAAQARGGGVKREKVDVIEVEYFDGASSYTTLPMIDGLLEPYLKHGGAVNIDEIMRS